jgi:hypothetical protein
MRIPMPFRKAGLFRGRRCLPGQNDARASAAPEQNRGAGDNRGEREPPRE